MNNARTEREKQVNELMKSLGVFWAFSKKRFDENKTPLQAGDKYVDIGAGGFMPKSNIDKFTDGMKAITDEFNAKMKEQKARREHIHYELNNHEAYYTRDITSTLDALGDEFTREEVLSVFDGRHNHN